RPVGETNPPAGENCYISLSINLLDHIVAVRRDIKSALRIYGDCVQVMIVGQPVTRDPRAIVKRQRYDVATWADFPQMEDVARVIVGYKQVSISVDGQIDNKVEIRSATQTVLVSY